MVRLVLFVHGWSVHDTAAYGGLPGRLAREVAGLTVKDVFLGKYVSFRDEVRMEDLAEALEAAVWRDIKPAPGERFAVVTHSTGGPVVRTWWQRHYWRANRPCPMSHVIHLAAAQFGSALAQLGKSRLGRIKGFFEGIEPGTGVLDWLELGSPEAWTLNREWAGARGVTAGDAPVFQFSLTGQCIDRRMYDVLNSYTGETASDGVVRVAASNLNTSWLRMVQEAPTPRQLEQGIATPLVVDDEASMQSETVPFRIVPGVSHSGREKGIVGSVRDDESAAPAVVDLIRRCLMVATPSQHAALAEAFAEETQAVVAAEHVEHEGKILRDRLFHRDAGSMLVIRVTDERGEGPEDFGMVFTGERCDPNRLPPGFLLDRQRNLRRRDVVTFFLNHDVLRGCPPLWRVHRGKRHKTRERLPGAGVLGLRVDARPDRGFAHYHPCEAPATAEWLARLVQPHRTVMLEIVLRRLVRTGAFRFTGDLRPADFRRVEPGAAIPPPRDPA